MERGKSKKPPGSGIARNRAAKNGRTCPLLFHLLINKNNTVMYIITSSLRFIIFVLSKALAIQNMQLYIDKILHHVVSYQWRKML